MGPGQQPVLEIREASGMARWLPFERVGSGRNVREAHWQAHPTFAKSGQLCFRIDTGSGQYVRPPGLEFFETDLRRVWVQDRQIFSYRPAHKPSPSQVLKIPAFKGRLPARALYVYLPRGYPEHHEIDYPVLYMQDGQNCFERYAADSFSGSWQAEMAADRLIQAGRMRECIIVAISHGGKARLAEYLPPGLIIQEPRGPAKKAPRARKGPKPRLVSGAADQTAAYYVDDVEAHVRDSYRVLNGREYRATCGSSMGGLFAAYLASQRPDFARQHALVSPSFWVAKTPAGSHELIETLVQVEPKNVRLWLDAGTENDGQAEFEIARDLLLERGCVPGPDFEYYLDEGAGHNEAAWAERLHRILPFLYPVQ